MGMNIGHVVAVSAVLGLSAFVYVVGFAPIDEQASPRAGALNRVPDRATMISTIRRQMARGRIGGADQTSDLLLKHNPEDPGAYFYRAWVDHQLGATESALANWTVLDAQLRGLNTWPTRYTDAQLEYFRAWAKRGIGEIEQSQVIFGKMSEDLEGRFSKNADSEITNTGILYNLACYRSMAGDIEVAIDHWERAVELGYRSDGGWWAVDLDLEPLHSSERFWAAGQLLGRGEQDSDPDAGRDGSQDTGG